MRLETHRGIVADPLDPSLTLVPELRRRLFEVTVRSLTATGEAYVILDDGPEEYVQAAGTVAEGFIVERRDGSAGEHYRGDRRVTADELVTMLDGYMRLPDWSHIITWHRITVDIDRRPRA